MHGGQKGFTLIELLVVIAILGVIAAIVALNVGVFFGRGTLQAANTELHQVQTAIIAAMADAESGTLTSFGAWSGGNGTIQAGAYDAATYVYGPFRATYYIEENGSIDRGELTVPEGRTAWSGIHWDGTNKGWASGDAP